MRKTSGKNKGFLLAVDTEDGYAFNIHLQRPGQLEKKLSGKDGLDSGEQPPVEVLQAMAAAGSLPDWLQSYS